MLRKKIHRHENESVIHPPRAGPMAGATTTATPYRAKAAPRLGPGNVSVRIACSLGASPPPPIPCVTRASSRTIRLGAIPQKNELIVNSATQPM